MCFFKETCGSLHVHYMFKLEADNCLIYGFFTIIENSNIVNKVIVYFCKHTHVYSILFTYVEYLELSLVRIRHYINRLYTALYLRLDIFVFSTVFLSCSNFTLTVDY